MAWHRQVQFVAAVPMPGDWATEFGTTVNGMWASPERLEPADVDARHLTGERILFSVPMIALTPNVYREPDGAPMLEEVCRDVHGERAECGWYYWERDPVYAACIYSEPFRAWLMQACREGVDRGLDVVNLDEVMTSIGLMNREPRGSGFCARCLGRFRAGAGADPTGAIDDASDEDLRARLLEDDALYARYRAFHDREAFRVMVGFIDELASYAHERNPDFVMSANVGYLGNHVDDFGPLWGCMWGPHLDLVLFENDYRVTHDGPHQILPRGSFAPWYRLGSAFNGSPSWICPSINVPRQLADEDRRTYHELMFLESYTVGGRWGFYWWPGVDAETRRVATAPDAIAAHIRFIADHRAWYEDVTSVEEVAVVYLDGPVLAHPEGHRRYVALAQALGELGVQFDVRWVGDGDFNPDDLDPASLARYRAILVPEARDLGARPTAALETVARGGTELIAFSESPIDPALVRREDGAILTAFWDAYADEDRERIGATVASLPRSWIRASDPSVRVVRSASGSSRILQVLNLGYEPDADRVRAVEDLHVRVPWDGGPARCTVASLDGERAIEVEPDGAELVLPLGRLDRYALVVLEPV